MEGLCFPWTWCEAEISKIWALKESSGKNLCGGNLQVSSLSRGMLFWDPSSLLPVTPPTFLGNGPSVLLFFLREEEIRAKPWAAG